MANCFSLQQKVESEEVALVVKTCNPAIDASAGVGGQSGFWVYAPFVMGGFKSLGHGDGKVPVAILRDTGASQSFMLKDVLPFPDVTSKSALVQGIGMECLEVPVHKV